MNKQTKINIGLFFTLWILAKIVLKEHYTLVKWSIIAILLPIYGPRLFEWLKTHLVKLKDLKENDIDEFLDKAVKWSEKKRDKMKAWAEKQGVEIKTRSPKRRLDTSRPPRGGSAVTGSTRIGSTSKRNLQNDVTRIMNGGEIESLMKKFDINYNEIKVIKHHNKQMIRTIDIGDNIIIKMSSDPRLTDRSSAPGMHRGIAKVIDKNADRIVMEVFKGLNSRDDREYETDPFIIKSNDNGILIEKIINNDGGTYDIEDLPKEFEF